MSGFTSPFPMPTPRSGGSNNDDRETADEVLSESKLL